VEGIGTLAEDGGNRNSCRRRKEYKFLQKVEGIGAPEGGERKRNSGRRCKE
jgi:hypothetical protein